MSPVEPLLELYPMSSSSPRQPILVIDDNLTTSKALTKILELNGYDVVPALSCSDANAWLDAHIARPPAAILADIHLPDGSGIDVAKRARALYDDAVPIFVLSGDTSIENLKALPQGSTMFIAKPLHAPSLLDELRNWTAAAR